MAASKQKKSTEKKNIKDNISMSGTNIKEEVLGKNNKNILKLRAQQLAREGSDQLSDKETIKALVFWLGREKYAIETSFLKEVAPLKDITFLPCTPEYITGIINVRGTIISIIDVKKVLGLHDQKGISDIHEIIMIEDREFIMGIVSDMIEGFYEIPTEDIQEKLPESVALKTNMIKGIAKGDLIILDIRNILTDKNIIVNEQV